EARSTPIRSSPEKSGGGGWLKSPPAMSRGGSTVLSRQPASAAMVQKLRIAKRCMGSSLSRALHIPGLGRRASKMVVTGVGGPGVALPGWGGPGFEEFLARLRAEPDPAPPPRYGGYGSYRRLFERIERLAARCGRPGQIERYGRSTAGEPLWALHLG